MKELREYVCGSIEPLLIDDEFIERIVKLKKVCHHFHLSLQSGCTETLQRMNRRYTTEQFSDIVQHLRNAYADVMLTTDIIVGFPGETEEEFCETYKFLEKIKFYKMHIFKFSVRTGTKAAKMDNQVSNEKKEVRSKKLIDLSEKNQFFYNEQYIGQEVEVLIEEKDGDYYKGHTSNYLLVEVLSDDKLNLENQIVNVKIHKAVENAVIGKIVT